MPPFTEIPIAPTFMMGGRSLRELRTYVRTEHRCSMSAFILQFLSELAGGGKH